MSTQGLALVWAWPPGMLVAAVGVLVALLLERRAGRSRAGIGLRAVLVALVGLALARPEVALEASGPVVWLVEGSAQAAFQEAVGARVSSDRRPTTLAYGGAGLPDLDEAIDVGRRLVGSSGRLVIVGTGAWSGEDPEAAVADAARSGVVVDAVHVGLSGPDAGITTLQAPAVWRADRPIPVAVGVRADRPMSGTVRVSVDGVPSGDEAAGALGVALDTTRVLVPGRSPGGLFLEARVTVEGDIEPGNDVASAVVKVVGPPRVLVVGEDEGGLLLADALTARGVRVDRAAPGGLPARLSRLEGWDVVALVDVPAASLGLDQMAAVEAFAAELGGGVWLSAGRQSFLAGGWAGTPLARLAPVELQPPAREAREPVALLLMVDTSASMGTLQGRTALSKLDLALEAAVLAAGVLRPGDRIGVIAYAESARWALPMQAVGPSVELVEVEAALRGLTSGGGTSMAGALELGLPALADLPLVTRHAVLIGDGRDFAPDRERNEASVRSARAAGVTLSTMAVGFDADRELLARLARLGRGRGYVADSAAELPRLTMEESEILSAGSEQSGEFRVVTAGSEPHPLAAGVDLEALPALQGYVAVTPRQEARVALGLTGGDALLVTWHYGLGRVCAWTSDVGESWAWDWAGQGEAEALWSALVDYLAPVPGSGPPGIGVEHGGEEIVVVADTVDAWDRVLDLADATLVITAGNGSRSVPMVQRAPGVYEARIAAPREAVGADVRVVGEGREQQATLALAPSSGPPRPAGSGRDRLADLAAVGGGRLLPAIAADERRPARAALAPMLLALAAGVLVVDIADQLSVRWAPRLRRPSGRRGMVSGDKAKEREDP